MLGLFLANFFFKVAKKKIQYPENFRYRFAFSISRRVLPENSSGLLICEQRYAARKLIFDCGPQACTSIDYRSDFFGRCLNPTAYPGNGSDCIFSSLNFTRRNFFPPNSRFGRIIKLNGWRTRLLIFFRAPFRRIFNWYFMSSGFFSKQWRKSGRAGVPNKNRNCAKNEKKKASRVKKKKSNFMQRQIQYNGALAPEDFILYSAYWQITL